MIEQITRKECEICGAVSTNEGARYSEIKLGGQAISYFAMHACPECTKRLKSIYADVTASALGYGANEYYNARLIAIIMRRIADEMDKRWTNKTED